jgi:hypothetical protein
MSSSNSAVTYSAAAIGGVIVIATVLTWIINASDATDTSDDVLSSTGVNEGDTSKDFSYTNPLQQNAGKKRKTSKRKSSKRKTLKRKYK